MHSQDKLVVAFVALMVGMASTPVWSQEGEGAAVTARTPSASPEAGNSLAPPNKIAAIRAGGLSDARWGRMLATQMTVVRGERIAEVAPGVRVPAGATVLDLGSATVLPGMIAGHVHLNLNAPTSPAKRTLIALANAQVDLDAGFTTVLHMDSRGGLNTVDIRYAI